MAIYDAGRREPIPLPLKTSYAWAEARHAGGGPTRGGVRSGTPPIPGENEDPAHQRVWGMSKLGVLLEPVRPGEECDGETTRLGAYAARLWLPMLRATEGLVMEPFDLLGPLPAATPRCSRPAPAPVRRSRSPGW